MPISAPIQNSFNAGEFTPLAYGRTDFAKYKNGVSLMQRYVCLIQGAATRMPGFLHKRQSKNKGKVRLMPFIFSNGDAFMIEMGDLYMRFYQNRAPVTLAAQNITGITKANPAVLTYSGADTYANGDEVYVTGVVGMTEINDRWFKVAGVNTGANTFQLTDVDGANVNSTAYTTYTSGGTVAEVYEIVSPYALADVFDVRFLDSGDVIYLAHPSYAPRKLSRSAATSWTFSTVSFKDGPYMDINTGATLMALSATSGGANVSIVINSIVGINTDTGFQSTDVGRLVRWKNKDGSWIWLTITAYVSTTKVTATISGNVNASTIKTITSITKANPAVVGAPAHGVSNGDSIYISDVIGMTQVNNLFFVAAGVTANTLQLSGVDSSAYTTYSSGGKLLIIANKITAITAASPAVVTSAAHNFAIGDNVYIDGVLGMTQINAGFYTITATTVNTYTLALDASGFTAYSSGGAGTLASVNWRVGEWSATTGYPSVLFTFEDRIGWAASPVAPQTMNLTNTGDYENFAPTGAGGTVVATNALQLRLNSGTQDPIRWVRGDELGLLMGTRGAEWVIRANTTGEAISALNLPSARQSTNHGSAFQEPIRIGKAMVFVQTSKRKLREMAYVFQFDGFSAPDMTLLAEHITKTGVNGMAYQKEPFSNIWCTRTDGKLIGVTYDKDQDVLGWHGHPLGGYSDAAKTLPPIVESVASIPSPDGSQDDLWASVQYYTNGYTRRFIGYLADFNTDFDDVADNYFVDFGIQGTVSSPSTTIRGLWHIEGQTVDCLIDGSPVLGKVVSGGAITLANACKAKYSIGFGYSSRLKNLRIEAGSATGTAQGKKKRVHKLKILLHQTVGLRVGRDFDNMDAITFRKESDPIGAAVPLFSGIKLCDYEDDYNDDAYICIEQNQPMASTILAIMPQLHTEDAQ